MKQQSQVTHPLIVIVIWYPQRKMMKGKCECDCSIVGHNKDIPIFSPVLYNYGFYAHKTTAKQ